MVEKLQALQLKVSLSMKLSIAKAYKPPYEFKLAH